MFHNRELEPDPKVPALWRVSAAMRFIRSINFEDSIDQF